MGVVRVGLLGRSGAGACPDLLQRRPGPGSAARRSAEYQRFSSGALARSGPLQQIWTTCAAAVLPGGRPRVGRRPRRAPLTPRRALRTRECSSNRCSRKQNAHLECKVHISRAKCTSRRGGGRSRSPRPAAPVPPRSISSEKGSMTPFPMSAGAAAHPKSTRWPPSSTPSTSRTATAWAPQRGHPARTR